MRVSGVLLALLLRTAAVVAQCQTCTCDGCLATLDPSAHYAISQTADASASAACVSWPGMSTTTTLAPTTMTITVTHNVTKGVTTDTTTTINSTQTVFGTVTSTYTSTDVIQSTAHPTTTVVTTSTSLVYTTIGTKSYFKRQASASPSPSSTAPIPSEYSPYCAGGPAFLSACHCIGVTQTTFTSSGLTATATVTVNQTISGSTEVDVSTAYSPVTAHQTSTARASTVVVSSSIATSYVTQASVVETVSTSTVSTSVATSTPSGYVQVQDASSPVNGYWLSYDATHDTSSSYAQVNLTNDPTLAMAWALVPSTGGAYLESQNIDPAVYAVMPVNYASAPPGANNDWDEVQVLNVGAPSPSPGPGTAPLVCKDTITPDGPLSCTTYGDTEPAARTELFWCGPYGSPNGVVLSTANDVRGYSCTPLNLYFNSTNPAPRAASVHRLDADQSNYQYPDTVYLWSPATSDTASCFTSTLYWGTLNDSATEFGYTDPAWARKHFVQYIPPGSMTQVYDEVDQIYDDWMIIPGFSSFNGISQHNFSQPTDHDLYWSYIPAMIFNQPFTLVNGTQINTFNSTTNNNITEIQGGFRTASGGNSLSTAFWQALLYDSSQFVNISYWSDYHLEFTTWSMYDFAGQKPKVTPKFCSYEAISNAFQANDLGATYGYGLETFFENPYNARYGFDDNTPSPLDSSGIGFIMIDTADTPPVGCCFIDVYMTTERPNPDGTFNSTGTTEPPELQPNAVGDTQPWPPTDTFVWDFYGTSNPVNTATFAPEPTFNSRAASLAAASSRYAASVSATPTPA